MTRVITIAREFGSGGASIGRLLAARLHWRLLDRELVAQIAQAAQVGSDIAAECDEKVDPWLHRLAKHAFLHGAIERPVGIAEAGVFDSETMLQVGTSIIEQAAGLGSCVIVGRGAQCILHGRPGVFHVFLYAPMALRMKRAAALLGDAPDLEQRIREKDRERAAGVRHYFGQEWCNPNLYDLMLNTVCGDETAVDTIMCAARLPLEVPQPA